MTIETSSIPAGWSVGSSITSMLGGANPAIGAISALSSVFGGGSKTSTSGAKGEAYSGGVDFRAKNSVNWGGFSVDLEDPVHIAIAAGVLVGGIWIWHKQLKKVF